MTKFRCKHCWQEIVPARNHGHAKWVLTDKTTTDFMRWSCLQAPQKMVYNPRGAPKTGTIVGRYSKANKGSVVVGLHEPHLEEVQASLAEVIERAGS